MISSEFSFTAGFNYLYIYRHHANPRQRFIANRQFQCIATWFRFSDVKGACLYRLLALRTDRSEECAMNAFLVIQRYSFL